MVRKVLLSISLLLMVICSLLLVLPLVFKDKIVERIKQEVNSQLDVRFDFGDFGLSFFRHFPDVTLRVDDISVVGRGAFAGDTLAGIGRLRLSFDVMSLFRGDAYEIKKVFLDRPRLLFKLLDDGAANWDVMPANEDMEDDAESSSMLALDLDRLEIRSGHVVYLDDLYDTYIYAHDIHGAFRARMRGDVTSVSTREAVIGSFSLRYDQWPVLSRVRAVLTAEMDADLDRFVFTFRDNQIMLNDLPLVFQGMVGWPVDELEMDFSFGAARSDFASFISLIPALYTKDFEQLQTSGQMTLEGHVRGSYTDTSYPGFGLNLEVTDGMFRYPGLPASVEKVQLKASIFNPGQDLDLTVVDVPRFSMVAAGAPLEARLFLKTPVSDPQFDVSLSGGFDLSTVEQFYPLGEGMVLRGTLQSDLELRGALSAFEKPDFDAIHADGMLAAQDIYVMTPQLDAAVEIAQAAMVFNPSAVRLESFDMKLGESDMQAFGDIYNIPGFIFGGQLLRGTFQTRSSYFDLGWLMDQVPPSEEKPEVADSEADTIDQGLSAIRIPANIDFTLDAGFDRLRFGKLELAEVAGIIHIAEEQAVMERLSMNLLGGTLELDGYYDASDVKPYVNLGLQITGLDIRQTFENFNTARVLAPIGAFARGAFSARLQLSSLLEENLMPVLASLKGGGGMSASSVMLQGTPAMSDLAGKLQMDQFREMSLKDLALSFSFADGKLDLPPFGFMLGDIKATLAGSTFFDKRIVYALKLDIPRAMFGSGANRVLDDLTAKAASAGITLSPSEYVNLDVGIGGTFLRPEVSVSMAALRANLEQQLRQEADRLLEQAETRLRDEAGQLREQVETQIEDRIDDARDKVDAELEARIALVLEEANRQADNVRAQAVQLAANVRREAASQAQKLEAEAGSPLAKAAARQAGQQLIREAERRATQLEAEGERNAQRIIDEANKRAEQLRQERP